MIKQVPLQATGPVLLPEFLPAAIKGRSSDSKGQPSAAMDLTASSSFINQRLLADSTSLYGEFQAVTDHKPHAAELQSPSFRRMSAAITSGAGVISTCRVPTGTSSALNWLWSSFGSMKCPLRCARRRLISSSEPCRNT